MKNKIAELISLNSDMSDDLLFYTITLTLNNFLPVKVETVFGTRSSVKRIYKVIVKCLIFRYTFYVSIDYDPHSYIPCLKRYHKVKNYTVWNSKQKGLTFS